MLAKSVYSFVITFLVCDATTNLLSLSFMFDKTHCVGHRNETSDPLSDVIVEIRLFFGDTCKRVALHDTNEEVFVFLLHHSDDL